jgi:hypothetical protein
MLPGVKQGGTVSVATTLTSAEHEFFVVKVEIDGIFKQTKQKVYSFIENFF